MTIKHLVIFATIFGVVWSSPQFNQGMGSPTIWGNEQESDYDTNAYEADYFVNHDHASENDGEILDGNFDALSQYPSDDPGMDYAQMENLEDNDEGKVSKRFISNPFSTNPFSNWDLFNNHRVSKLESQYGNLHSHVARVAQANDHISNKMDNMDKKMVAIEGNIQSKLAQNLQRDFVARAAQANNHISNKMDKKMEAMEEKIKGDLVQMLNKSFGNVEKEFGTIKKELGSVQKEFGDINREMSSMNKTMFERSYITNGGCNDYQVLNDATRKVSYRNTRSYSNCDQLGYSKYTSKDWKGSNWYRFASPAGTRMPDKAPTTGYGTCGTNRAGWIQGQHPTEKGQTVRATACFTPNSSYKCQYSNEVLIRNCGNFFIYYLPDTLICPYRYCSV